MRSAIHNGLFWSFLLCTQYLAAQEAHAYDEAVLELNEGKKWLISEAMVKPLQASFDLIDGTASVKKDKGRKLFRKLWRLADKIEGSCYLEGEGHHYFHTWYLTYVDLLEQLRDELFAEDAETLLFELKNAVVVYHRYFE